MSTLDPSNSDFWSRDHFDWADEVESEDSEEYPQENAPLVKGFSGILWEYLTDDTDDIHIISAVEPSTPSTPPTTCDSSESQYVCKGKERVATLETIYEEEPVSDTNAVFCVDLVEEISREPTNQNVESLATEVVYEFAWRAGYMLQHPDVHHFNWLGEVVPHRSATLPEESLAIMLAKPKVPEATDNYLVQSILRRAYRYLDPVIVCLDEEIDSSLLILRGSALQRAAVGHCFKHYTSHGEWMYDSEEPAKQNTVDIGEISTYLSPNSIIGNGFVRNGHIRSRGEVQQLRDEEIAYPPRITRGRDWKRKYKPSTLRQCATIAPEPPVIDNTAVIKRKPVPSPVASPPATPTPVRVSLTSLTLASFPVPDASPSNYTSHSSTEVDSKSKTTSRRPAVRPARASPASNATDNMDSSRDPNVYFSFPQSRVGETKLQRCFRKMKEFVQLQLSCVQGRR
ncbi:hypothetical protein N7493_007009 [Penicillium malachiteum]|uniref:Uncharacterized protein n=1 Tax=Penicillium malachiteum TaxID=1324776 RepID=A0AAD6MV71_9EURO|nr:hypothetical protein N7493_007009 [Penicillium malachiteum]